MKIIFKNGTVIKPYSDVPVSEDVYIDDGFYASPFSPDESTNIIDAKGKYIIPGLVDLHVHTRDPGQTHKEDIDSVSKAAARGGFTTICSMPNTNPVIDNVNSLRYVDEQGKKLGFVNLLTVSAMTKNQAGKELCDFKNLDKIPTVSKTLTGHGICGISEDGMSLKDSALMEKVCLVADKIGIPVMDHAEPEVEIIHRDIEISKKYNCHIHIQHVSKAESVALIREAKADGLCVTSEATPHHFSLERSATEIHGTNAKMNPPLGTEKDRSAVIEGLLDDTIDIIATDHAPHTEAEKNVPFESAPNGVIGLETAFPVSYTHLVKTGLMDIDRLIYKMSKRPQEIISVPVSTFEPGSCADLALISIDNNYRIDKNSFLSKGRNTPFHNMEVSGKIELTIHNGRITWKQ